MGMELEHVQGEKGIRDTQDIPAGWSEEVLFTETGSQKKEIYEQGIYNMGFPGSSVIKNPPTKAGDAGSIPWSGRCPGEGNGNPLQYSCLENPVDRGPWQAAVHGVLIEQLSTYTYIKEINKNLPPG